MFRAWCCLRCGGFIAGLLASVVKWGICLKDLYHYHPHPTNKIRKEKKELYGIKYRSSNHYYTRPLTFLTTSQKQIENIGSEENKIWDPFLCNRIVFILQQPLLASFFPQILLFFILSSESPCHKPFPCISYPTATLRCSPSGSFKFKWDMTSRTQSQLAK